MRYRGQGLFSLALGLILLFGLPMAFAQQGNPPSVECASDDWNGEYWKIQVNDGRLAEVETNVPGAINASVVNGSFVWTNAHTNDVFRWLFKLGGEDSTVLNGLWTQGEGDSRAMPGNLSHVTFCFTDPVTQTTTTTSTTSTTSTTTTTSTTSTTSTTTTTTTQPPTTTTTVTTTSPPSSTTSTTQVTTTTPTTTTTVTTSTTTPPVSQPSTTTSTQPPTTTEVPCGPDHPDWDPDLQECTCDADHPLWDPATETCELPFTGAGDWVPPVVAFGLGAMLLGGLALRASRRMKSTALR